MEEMEMVRLALMLTQVLDVDSALIPQSSVVDSDVR
jgi:hypothetical protein